MTTRHHHHESGRSTLKWHLIDVYLAGPDETPPSVYEAAARYVATQPAVQALITRIRSGELAAQEPPPTVEQAFADLEERLSLPAPSPHASGSSVQPRGRAKPRQMRDSAHHVVRRSNRYSVIAGVVAGLLIAVASLLFLQNRHTTRDAVMTTYTTNNAQRANILLPDGSRVALNVASRLDVPTDFLRGNRTVRLHGEALFTVTHHDAQPFTVVTGTTTARVLGTTFDVRRYDTDTTTTIAVSDGKVGVRSIVLTAQQQMQIGQSGQATVTPVTLGAFGFANGVLTLDHVSLKDAVIMLDRWYDVDIRIADSTLANNLVHASFVAGSQNDLGTMLQMIFDARVERDGRVLTIYSK